MSVTAVSGKKPCWQCLLPTNEVTRKKVETAVKTVFRFLLSIPLVYYTNIVYVAGFTAGIIWPGQVQDTVSKIKDWLVNKSTPLEKAGTICLGIVGAPVILFPVSFFLAADTSSQIALRKKELTHGDTKN